MACWSFSLVAVASSRFFKLLTKIKVRRPSLRTSSCPSRINRQICNSSIDTAGIYKALPIPAYRRIEIEIIWPSDPTSSPAISRVPRSTRHVASAVKMGAPGASPEPARDHGCSGAAGDASFECRPRSSGWRCKKIAFDAMPHPWCEIGRWRAGVNDLRTNRWRTCVPSRRGARSAFRAHPESEWIFLRMY